jgi:hypothetical protein
MIWTIIVLAVIILVFMLWTISEFENPCTGDCNQGRKCNCVIGKKDE